MLFNRMIACFSPSVPASLRSTWVQHGGSLTHSKHDFHQANVFFCAGTHDPWLQELLSRSLIVRHARWISKSVSERFMVPVSKYLLDDQFDLTKIEPAPLIASLTPPRMPLTSNQPLRVSDEEFATTVPNPNANTLKRALGSENHDESCTEIDIRPLKRARIQSAPSPSPSSQQLLVVQTHASRIHSPIPPAQPISLFPVVATRTRFYPSPANSSPLKTPNPTPRTPKASAPLRRIDFRALNPTPAMPLLSFPRPRLPRSRRTNNSAAPRLDFAPPIKPRPTIAALLRAPRATACVFTVYESYKEKEFSCEKITPP